MKPDRLNGHDILRPVITQDGVQRIESSSVFFPPSIGVVYPYEPLTKLAEIEAQQIVSMKAMKTSELRQRLYDFAKVVISNEQRKLPNG